MSLLLGLAGIAMCLSDDPLRNIAGAVLILAAVAVEAFTEWRRQ